MAYQMNITQTNTSSCMHCRVNQTLLFHHDSGWSGEHCGYSISKHAQRPQWRRPHLHYQVCHVSQNLLPYNRLKTPGGWLRWYVSLKISVRSIMLDVDIVIVHTMYPSVSSGLMFPVTLKLILRSIIWWVLYHITSCVACSFTYCFMIILLNCWQQFQVQKRELVTDKRKKPNKSKVICPQFIFGKYSVSNTLSETGDTCSKA